MPDRHLVRQLLQLELLELDELTPASLRVEGVGVCRTAGGGSGAVGVCVCRRTLGARPKGGVGTALDLLVNFAVATVTSVGAHLAVGFYLAELGCWGRVG